MDSNKISDTFCILPWIHLHVYPSGDAYPCCLINDHQKDKVGSTKQNTIEELANSEKMKEMRLNMLAGQKCSACVRCYEQEQH